MSFAALLERRPVGRLQRRVLVLSALCGAFDGFDMQSFGFLVPAISRTMHVPLAAMTTPILMGLIGLAIGAVLLGRLADRTGRRPILIASLMVAGVGTLATAAAGSVPQIGALRLLAGIGLGGAVPALTATVAEFFPQRLRPVMICAVCAAVPLGGLLASLLGAQLLPLFGWRPVLVVGGLLPLAIVPFLWAMLPESPGYLAAKGDKARQKNLLRSLWPDTVDVQIVPAQVERGSPFAKLFERDVAAPTLLLWTIVFMNLLSLYFFVNWLPSLLSVAHLPDRVGVYAIAAFSLGGIVGQVAQGPIVTRFGMIQALSTELAIVLAAIVGLATVPISVTGVLVMVTVLSIALQAGQAGVIALAASFYRAELRSTAIGAMLAMGRIGAIVGPYVGGIALGYGLAPQRILLLLAVPTAVALTSVLVLGRRLRFSSRSSDTLREAEHATG